MKYNEVICEAKPFKTIWYHRTTADRIDSILENGLKINSEKNLTLGGISTLDYYGLWPIFLSTSSKTMYTADAPIIIEVDVTGLKIVADLPSLSDLGAYLSEDDVWFEGSKKTYDMVEILTPGTPACEAMIRKTKSAACLTDIPPNKVKLSRLR
jgi:hypothetical protein